ncbi:winged helix-turn-helix domain-containing protein [Streptomyces sp. NPDC053474]|uniref:winged helix-turn-helix domain-containing protein n=1 Tax=Streptomyces sp. NPDC053474 TaxID=3365704 RepID=UPI0037D7C2DC
MPSPRTPHAAPLPIPTSPVRVAPAEQWVSTTRGRIAPDGFSWMQAVCWVHHADTYRPARDHGPRKVGDTTLRVAVELARLAPCRPGVDYLARVLRLSRRTVQYHLGILRETGLLAYRLKGTRVRGAGRRASEFVWTIPPSFDTALHLRTRPHGQLIRSLCGIGEQGRRPMKRLAAMAQKLMRRGRRPGPRSRSSRCTPMGGTSTGPSPAGSSSNPPESKLARGQHASPRPTAQTRRPLNTTGRRFQLAGQIVTRVAWLRGSAVPRIAWVIRDLADAGWSVDEVCAWLHLRGRSTNVHRPSGLLAVLLRGAADVLDTPAKREHAVAQWHAAVEAARRHRIQDVRARQERFEGPWRAPRSAAVRRQVTEAVSSIHVAAPRGETVPALTGPQDLTHEDLQVMRQSAWAEVMQGQSALVLAAIEAFGRPTAQSMYGRVLVDRVLTLAARRPLEPTHAGQVAA